MYQKSNISLLELTHEYFTGWLFVQMLKGWRPCTSLFLPSFCAVLWKWKTYFSVFIPHPCDFFHYSTLPHPYHCISLMHLMLPAFPLPPLTPSLLPCPRHSPQTPLSLFVFSYFHLKSCSFPGGWNLVELRERTGSDLFIILCMFVAFASTILTSSIFY